MVHAYGPNQTGMLCVAYTLLVFKISNLILSTGCSTLQQLHPLRLPVLYLYTLPILYKCSLNFIFLA